MEQWVTTWGMAPQKNSARKFSWSEGKLWMDYRPLDGRTYRYSYYNNLNGSAVRVLFSNREGIREMCLGAASLCVSGGEMLPLTFGGEKTLVLAPGGDRLSDPVVTPVRAGNALTLSLYLTKVPYSGNNLPGQLFLSRPGDYTLSPQFDPDPDATLTGARVLTLGFSRIDVLCEEEAGAVVFFGDSIVQMATWLTWLDGYLGAAHPGRYSVVNLGIGGNRLLHDPLPQIPWCGDAGVSRFGKDVLTQCGGEVLVFLIGTNDFGHVSADDPEWVTAEQLLAGLETLAAAARRGGYRKVIGTTVLPTGGHPEYTDPRKEAEREKLNRLMKASPAFDAVLDMDRALAMRTLPGTLCAAADSGDHLHPGPLGGRMMAAELIRTLQL